MSSAGCLTHSVRHFWKVSESDVEYRLHVSVHGGQQGHVEKSTEGVGKGDTGSCWFWGQKGHSPKGKSC